MGDNYFSLPTKRTLLMSNPTTTTTTKRPKQPTSTQPPPPVPPGHATLRILCHASHIGAFIGKSGSSIKHLQLDTGSRIRVEDPLLSNSDHRVISVVAPTVPFKRLPLPGGVQVEVSALQEAGLRVFEKVLEVSKAGTGAVVCRILIEESEAGVVIGKGGKMVEKLRRESGAKIRVLKGDHLPPGVSSPNEVVEIEGDVVAVKKGLLGVCGRLQVCPQVEKSSIKESKPAESTSQQTFDFRVDSSIQQPPFQFRADPHHQRTQLDFHADPPHQRTQLNFRVDPPQQRTQLDFRVDSPHQRTQLDFRVDPPHQQTQVNFRGDPPLQRTQLDFHGDSPLKQTELGIRGDPLLQHTQLDFHGDPSLQRTQHVFRGDPPLQRTQLDFRGDPPHQRTQVDYRGDPPLQHTQLHFRVDPLLRRTPLPIATTSSSPALAGNPMSFEAERPGSTESNLQQHETTFRILCMNDKVGGIIGRGGSIVRALEVESGATITIGPSVTNCNERMVTVTSKENVESIYSPAQRAVVLVFSRYAETVAEKAKETDLSKGSSVTARLVVQSNQVGCLLGKGGAIVAEMRKATGANIRILRGEQLPKCASDDDQVVEITGEFVKTQDALHQVTSRLRSNILPSKVTNVPGSQTSTSVMLDTSLHGRVRDPIPIDLHQSFGTSYSSNGQSTVRLGAEPFIRPRRLDHSSSTGFLTETTPGVNPSGFVNLGRSLASANGGLELGSAKRPTIVTNTTVEILVPERDFSSVYGESGSNLTRVRQISGAKIIVREASPGTRDRTVVISGTPDETQAAQSLLHAFILTGSI